MFAGFNGKETDPAGMVTKASDTNAVRVTPLFDRPSDVSSYAKSHKINFDFVSRLKESA